jgi:hypothetical protein
MIEFPSVAAPAHLVSALVVPDPETPSVIPYPDSVVGLLVIDAHPGVIVTELAPVSLPFASTTPTMDVVALP